MKKNYLKLIVFFPLLILISSCSSLVNKIAVKSTGAVLSEASKEVFQEGNWDIFYHGVPGNLKLLESLNFISSGDRNVLSALIKGYSGYAFVVNETLSIDEDYNELDIKPNAEQATLNYSKAVSYGEKYLGTFNITYQDISKASSSKSAVKQLFRDVGSSESGLETLFFIGQAYGGLILMNRDNMSLVAKRPLVQSIFDYVCQKKPRINHGACEIFYGANLVLTPAMMGGNPGKGQEIFLRAIKEYPNNYFIRVAYLQFYIIPFEEEDEYEEHLSFLQAKEKEFRSELEFNPNRKDNFVKNDLKLFQSIAFKRLEIIKRHSDNFF